MLTSLAENSRETWYRVTGRSEVAEQLRAERDMNELLRESVGDLERALYDPGWERLTALGQQEFSRSGMRQLVAICRLMAIKNGLIKRGLSLRQTYVWGQDCHISARAVGDGGDEDVNAVVQSFLDDPSNRRTFTAQQARKTLEHELGVAGNVFLALFTAPRTGRVQVRAVPMDEVTDVITNPQDNSEPWFYRREWWENREATPGSGVQQVRRSAYYPALGYRPRLRPRRVTFPGMQDDGLAEAYWDAPMIHVAVNRPLGWRFGIPDAYAAVDWARAYKDFLTDWATLVKALSRFAWRLTSKGSKLAQAKARMGQGPVADPVTGEPRRAGGTAVMPQDMALEAVPKTGATIDSESGRPLAAMVASALGVPVTMLLGDPGTTGARATAQTLDRPTELEAQERQTLWRDTIRLVLDHVVDQAVRAPDGALSGSVVRDRDGREQVILAGDTDRTLDVTFPDLDEVDAATVVKAIVDADSTTYMPPLVVLRLLLESLGVRDTDSILEGVTGPDGGFVPPGVSAGQAAVDAFRRGEDPAALAGGDGA